MNKHIPKFLKKFGKRIYFQALCHFDNEIRSAKLIIEKTARKNGLYNLDPSTDHRGNWVFLDRIKTNPRAFRLSYWDEYEIDQLHQYPQLTGNILDFGCGSGHLDVLLARRGKRVIGLDTSEIGINLAHYLRNTQPINVRNSLSFVHGDITTATTQALLHKMSISAIWSTHVFEHIRDPSNIFLGIRQSVPKNTPILIVVPLGYAYDDPDHVHHWHSEDELNNFLSHFITTEDIRRDDRINVLRALCRV